MLSLLVAGYLMVHPANYCLDGTGPGTSAACQLAPQADPDQGTQNQDDQDDTSSGGHRHVWICSSAYEPIHHHGHFGPHVRVCA